jgi:hypothetical protein
MTLWNILKPMGLLLWKHMLIINVHSCLIGKKKVYTKWVAMAKHFGVDHSW